MKAVTKIPLFLVACATLLSCSPTTNAASSLPAQNTSSPTAKGLSESLSGYARADDITTYSPFDGEKTQIIVADVGVSHPSGLETAFAARHPEVQFVSMNIAGSTSMVYNPPLYHYLQMDEKEGLKPDIIYSAFSKNMLRTGYFEDLSGYDGLLSDYYSSALSNLDIDGKIYALPGPTAIYSFLYNATLFEQWGLSVPTSFSSFLTLCQEIKKKSDEKLASGEITAPVIPFNANAKYGPVLLRFLEGCCYEEMLAGSEKSKWMKAFEDNSFQNGAVPFDSHFQPLLDVFKRCVDAGIILCGDAANPDAADFGYSATTRGNEFSAGRIAMISSVLDYTYNSQKTFSFKALPFFDQSSSTPYLVSDGGYSCAVVKDVQRSEAKKKLIEEYLRFVSSEDGQKVYIGKGLMLPTVKNSAIDPFTDYPGLSEVIAKGNYFTAFLFNYGDSNLAVAIRDALQAYGCGAKSAAETLSSLNESYYSLIKNGVSGGEKIATLTEDLNSLETSSLMADAFKSAAGTDLAIVPHGIFTRGNRMRLFKGDLYSSDLDNVVIPSSPTKTTLMKGEIKGSDLLALLSHPDYVTAGTDANCVYAFSGLQGKLAPWAPLGKKVLSLSLADGSAIENDKTYTLATWGGMVNPSRLTNFVSASSIATTANLFKSEFKKLGTLKKPSARYTLDWSVVS
jgi:raffinose/stachyose/melibiose transport system substrate-binding protein